MKKKIMVALLAGVMMLQQPVSGWCAQNTDSAQQSETTQEGDSSEDAAAGDTEDSAAGEGTAVTEDGENGGKARIRIRMCRRKMRFRPGRRKPMK